MLLDNHRRPLNYLRLAVTDRCNLRCHYCMPEHGLHWLSRAELLSYEEMLRLCRVLVGLGIQKIRITGGEPFVRKDMMRFLAELSRLPGLEQIHLTTNGVATAPLVPELKKIGIRSVNLSLDTLDRERFFQITRRDELPKVLDTMHALLRHDIPLKINAVVMDGQNTRDLVPLAELTRDLPVDVRFIEEMPFNGSPSATHLSADSSAEVLTKVEASLPAEAWQAGAKAEQPNNPTTQQPNNLPWDHRRILAALRERWPVLEKTPDPPHSTAMHYAVPGHRGKIGIIAAYSRTFCGTCNRIRVTPQGVLKTCLYDHGVLQIRDLLREGLSDTELGDHLLFAFNRRHRDGWAAEEARRGIPVEESMATIGG